MTQINNLGDHVDGTLIAEAHATKATTSNAIDNLVSDATQKPSVPLLPLSKVLIV